MTSPNNNERKPSTPGEGLSLLDLEHLPKPQYFVMRMVMREGECDYPRLLALLTPDHLTLADENFRPNLRRKSSRILSEFQIPRRNADTLRGIWENIEAQDDQ
jgi:hypothetical protein